MKGLIRWASVLNLNLSALLDEKLAEMDINSSQFFYITRICDMPGITQDKLFSIIYRSPSNITRALAALEQKGYIYKIVSPADKRTYLLFPTPKARTCCGKILSIINECSDAVLSDFTQEEKDIFMPLLEKAALKCVEIKRNEEEKGK